MFRYWDSSYDEDLMADRVTMNLLFLQVPTPMIHWVTSLFRLVLRINPKFGLSLKTNPKIEVHYFVSTQQIALSRVLTERFAESKVNLSSVHFSDKR